MAPTPLAAGSILAATRRSIEALLGDIGSLLADLTSQEHPAGASDDDENDEARRVIDVELQRFWQGYYELKHRHEENTLSVAVLALTKSGKSTLLNALMGMEVLPMNNVPETARVCRITHDVAAREPLLRDATGKALVRGEAAVRACLQQLNSAARSSCGPMSPQPSTALGMGLAGLGLGTVDDANEGGNGASSSGSGGGLLPPSSSPLSSSSSLLHISAPLVGLEGYGPELGRVTLLDTPGPNEAGEEQLKHQVERLLEGVDCVLYLLDYTKLKTAEEEGLFRRLRAINPQLVARLSSRLFFVVNKVDASETSEGLDPDEVRIYVADLVTRQLGAAAASSPPPPPAVPQPSSSLASVSLGALNADAAAAAQSGSGPLGSLAPGSLFAGSGSGGAAPAASATPFRLHPDQVLLLSARNALLARLVLGGRASPDAMKRFQRLAFGAFGGLGGTGGRGAAAAGPSSEQVRAAAGALLGGSGVLDLEGRVLTFLAAHAGSVKVLATADDITRLLAQVRNVALACRSCLHRNVAALREEVEGLRGQLAGAAAAFEEVRARTDAVKAEVVDEIKAHLNTLRRRLFTHIVQTLDTDAHAPAPHTAGPNSRSGSAHTSPAAAPTSRWHRVREKFLSMFTSSSSALPPQPPPGPGGFSGPSLVPEARSRSREELQALLLDLHDDLMGQIHSEVYDFWGVLEACVGSRHSELLSALNAHLAALSRRVEGAVSEALGLQLAATDLRLRPPSAEQLHSDVAELIQKGIRESTEKHIRVGARTTTERVFRQPQGPPSLCRWGGYWVEVPRTRTVVETYTATVFSLRPDEITNHFIGLVDGAVSASERALGAYVGEMVERQLAAAKDRIRDYGDRYLSVMSAALTASSRGAECRSAALASVEGYLARLEQLVGRAEAAQRDAEAAVPGGASGLLDEVEVYEEEDECGGGGVGQAGYAQEVEEQQQQLEEKEAPAAGAEWEEQEAAREEREEGNGGAAATTAGGGKEEEEAQGLLSEAGQRVTGEEQQPSSEQELQVSGGAGGAEEAAARYGVPVAGDEDGDEAEDATPLAAVTQPSSGAAAEAEPERDTAIPDIDDAGAGGPAALAAMPAEHVEAVFDEGGDAAVGAVVTPDDALPAPGGAAEQLTAAHDPMSELLSGDVERVAAVGELREAMQPKQQVAAATGGGTAPSSSSQVGSALHSGSSACGTSSYAGLPFDYNRAFLTAMSSSEMATGAGGARLDEPLSMIPLTVDGDDHSDGGVTHGGRSGEAGRLAAGGGSDTPRSGESGDWQLVEEEALDAPEAAGAAADDK